MAARVRERAVFAYLNDLRERYTGQVVSADLLQSLYCDFADHFFPEVEKSTPGERQTAYDRIMDWLEGLDNEAEATVAEAKRVGGLKPKSRSDSMWVNKVPFPASGLLTHEKGQNRWVKRIGHSNGVTPPAPDVITPAASDDVVEAGTE